MRRIVFTTILTFAGLFALPAQAQNNTISTVAGGAVNPASPTAAYIPGVYDAVRDGAGNTYISAPTLNVVYKVTPAGTMTIYAGTGTFGDTGDGGPATKATLELPEGLALDSAGNLFIADVDNNRIRRVDAQTQIMTTVAGSGLPFFPAYSGDHGPATSAGLNFPRGVAVDANGNVFIADTGNQVVRMVDNTAQHIITTYAGIGTQQGTPGTANGDGGAATSAHLANPKGVALDSAGNLYIADTSDGVIRKVDNTAAHIITTYAGSPSTINTSGGNGGPAAQAGLTTPNGVFVDAAGNLFIADTGNMAVRKVDTTASHTITAVAGNGTGCFDPSTGCGNGGAATSAALNQPSSVSVDSNGNVIIADTGTQTVRVVSGGNISVFAGGASGGDGGAATSAILGLANVVAVDANGNLFILEQFGERVREVATGTQTITTIAGTGAKGGLGSFGSTNTTAGPALKATFISPFAMTMDKAGNIYVADARGLVVRKITATSPRQISTIAGNGNFCQTGTCGDGGAATSAEFQLPSGLAVDSANNLYISDGSLNVIRVLNQTTGVINTFAGTYGGICPVYNSNGSACGDGGAALSATLNSPFALAFDSKGNLYVADSGDNAVRMISTSGVIGPYAFNGLPGFAGDGSDALSASMTEAQQIAFDPADNLYIGGGIDNVVRRVDGVDHSIITVAGDVENLVGGFSGDGGPATKALIGNLGAAVDANHNLYIADGFQRVRKVHLAPVTAVDKTLFTGAFGNVLAGQASLSQDITITNNGLDDLLISNFTFPASFAVFSTCSGLNGVPNSVAPGEDCILNIAFAPPAGIAGTINGTISMNTNDAANPTLSFPVSGTVGAAPGDTLTVTVSPLPNGPQAIPSVSSAQLGIACPTTCSANFAAGEVVELEAIAPAGSTFTGWSGAGCSGTGACSVTMNGAEAVTATFGTPTVSVSAIGNGSGTITTTPSSAIDCTYNGTATGGVCSAQLTGTNGLVTLTANANAGSTFAGWMGFCSFTTGTGPCVLPLQALAAFGAAGSQATAVFSVTPQPFVKGQVFVGTAGGMIFVYNPTGTLAQVLNSGNTGGDIFGITFDKNGNLYAANPVANNNNQSDGSVEFFGNNGTGPTLFGTSTSFNTSPTSLVIDPTGNLFVSQTGGRQSLLEFPKASGTATPSEFFPPVDTGGVDWIELLDDNQTMLYTSGTNEIKAFNVLDSIFVSDFATGLPGQAAFAMRELPDKTLLVANLDRVVRLSPSGTVIQNYQPVKTGAFFVLNLDPNGTDFWTGDNVAGVLYQVNIASGAIDKQFSTGLGFNTLFGAFGGINGLAVFGQPQSGGTDVGVTMTATPNSLAVNANLTYTITVTNNGPLNATSVTATDAFPAGVNFVSAATTVGSCSGTTTVSCNLGTLNNGASATITIVVTPTQGGTLANTVNATSNVPDPNTSNNSATTSTTVTSATLVTLRVALPGTAFGTVTDNLGQIDCTQSGGANPGGTCTTQYPSGTQVILTESTPGTFAGWAGAPTACTVATSTCTLTVTAAETVNATFNPGPGTFPLTVTAGNPHTGSGTITSSPTGISCTLTGATTSGTCTSNFPAGTIVTLTSAAGGGSAFFGWSGTTPFCLTSSAVSCVAAMTAAENVDAEFTSGGGTVNVTVTGAGNVKDTVNAAAINCTNTAAGPQSGTCSAGYALGTSVTLTETPASGATFTGWGGTACANPTATTCAFTVNTAATPFNISATFGASGTGGGPSFTATTLPAGAVTVPYGADIPVTGGTPPYTFALANGSTLPAGFTLNSGAVGSAAPGHVSNAAPKAAGTFTFGVVVTDSTTPTPLTATATISMTIAAMPPNTQPGLLKGQYGMLLRGFNEVTGAEEGIVGSLTFDGTGNITTGALDVNSTGTTGIGSNIAATGVYVIGPDNRGVMSITPAGQAPGIFTFSVGNVLNGVASTAYLTSFTDVTGTGDLYAGTLQQQDPTSFNNAAFAGTYVYDNTGQNPQGGRAAEIGLVTLNNANAVTSGSADVNDEGLTGSIKTITGTYTTPDSNGRSLFSLTVGSSPSSVAVYVISANQVLHLTLDTRANNVLLLGTAERQLNPGSFSNASLAGPDILSMVGSSGTQATTSNIGVLTVTPGATPTVNATLDTNDQGTVTIGQAATGPLAIAANGRGTITFAGSTLIFYLTQADQAFVMASDTPVEFGKIVPQVGAPFSTTPFTNNNLFLGQQEAAQGHSSQFSGIATLGAANALTATDDESHAGGNTFFDQALGTFTYTVSPTGHFTLTSTTQGASSGYVVSPFEIIFMDTTGPASDPTPSMRPHVVIAQSIPAPTAPASPSVTLAPTSLTFAAQTVGTTSPSQGVTLTNSGNAALTITGITLTGTNPGDFAQTNTCPASLAAGANCTITVTFKPTLAGARSAAVSIADNAAGSPQAVPLTGTGTTATAPAVTLAPTSLTFAAQTVGTTSPSQAVTLTNSGSAALTVTGISVTGTNPGDFAQTNTCPASLAAGANCTITVTFTPSAAGARSAAVSIADNAAGSPQAVPLTGTGTTPVGPSPVPLITQPLVPDTAIPGGTPFTLTVNGTGFVTGATVNWNGSPRTTTFVSGSRLTAAITAADIATTKTVSITVTNPGASALSNVVFLTVRNPAATVSFTSATGSPITVGNGPFAVAVGDFNGDGIQDLAVANGGSSTVTILLGKGDGTFTVAAAPPGTFSGPSAILAADFNGDGKLDLAVLNGGNNTVTILMGNGNGTFSLPDENIPTTGSNPLAFVAGDFNGDGKMDLAVANYRSNNLTILLGNGDGGFTATDTTPATGSFPAAIVAGDFNKDGKLDLAVDNQCGAGGACTAGTVTILLGDGTGNFTPTAASPNTGSGPLSMAVADFNEDGNLDLAIPSDCGSSGTCTTNGAVTILFGDGTGNFTAGTTKPATGLRPYGIVVGDFNGDGKPDLAIANNDSNTISILLGDGNGNFTPIATPLATGAGPVFPSVGDFNNDGALDIVVPNSGSNTISVLLGAGAPASPTITIAPTSLTFAAQALNTTSPSQTVTVSNSGTVPVTFTNIATTGDFAGATLAQCPSLAVGSDPCVFQITFTPTANGTRTGAVTFTDNATGSPQVVTLTGTGGTTAGTVSLNPTSLTFAAQGLNTTSPAQTVTVANTGNVPVGLTGLGITGPFAIVSGAGAGTCTPETNLAVEASCTINVTFTPTAAGAASGVLSVSDNATGSPQTVALSGTGGQNSVTITIPPGGSTTATTTPGGTAFYGLTITGGQGVTGTVQLGCVPSSNLITCQVVPSTVTLTGTPVQIAFGITTFCQGSTNTGALLPFNFNGKFGWPIVTLAFAGMLWTLRRNRRLALSFAMILLMTLGSGACASLPKGPNGATPPGTYTLTLTATLKGQTQTLNNFLTLVVK